MANGTIKSSPVAASAAVKELVGIDTAGVTNQQVDFTQSKGIPGMTAGRQATNLMLNSITKFADAVLGQANKFPELAATIEERDVSDAQRWVD